MIMIEMNEVMKDEQCSLNTYHVQAFTLGHQIDFGPVLEKSIYLVVILEESGNPQGSSRGRVKALAGGISCL